MEKTGNYELLYIVHPDLEGSLDKVIEKVKGFIEKRNGKIIYKEDWGKKKLAYEINKSDAGIYILWYFEMPKEMISKLEKDLKITEEVMRFMILKIEDKPKRIENKKTTLKNAEKSKEIKKGSPKKSENNSDVKETVQSEKERMEKLDEKLEELLEGEENVKKEKEVKSSNNKKKRGGK